MPAFMQMGKKMGVQIRMVAAMSRKVPSKRAARSPTGKISHDWLPTELLQPVARLLRHLIQRHEVAKGRGDADQQQHHAGGLAGLGAGGQKARQLKER